MDSQVDIGMLVAFLMLLAVTDMPQWVQLKILSHISIVELIAELHNNIENIIRYKVLGDLNTVKLKVTSILVLLKQVLTLGHILEKASSETWDGYHVTDNLAFNHVVVQPLLQLIYFFHLSSVPYVSIYSG